MNSAQATKATATGPGASLTGAAAEPLPVDPWSLAPGTPIPPYGVPAKYENKVVRKLSNPNFEPRTSQARNRWWLSPAIWAHATRSRLD